MNLATLYSLAPLFSNSVISYSVICYTVAMVNPFKRFMTVLQPAGGSVIGIDIGSAYLKVVQLRRKVGKAVLETYGELALGPYAGSEIGRATNLPVPALAEALRDLLREAHVTTANGAVAVPFASSLVTTIDMPALSEQELSSAVPIEARKYVPVPISEVSLDWWIVPPSPREEAVPSGAQGDASRPALAPSPKLRVLIAAVHNEAMTRFESVMREAGITAGFFEIEIFSTIRALFPQDLLPHAILDMGAAETKLYIIDQGLLRFSHIINYGAQDLTLTLSRALNISVEEAEKLKRTSGLSVDEEASSSLRGLLDFTFVEANRAIQSFEHRFGRTVSNMLLSGGGANLAGIGEFAAEASRVSVTRADPFAQVEAPAFLDEILKSVGPEFSVALGIAFRRLQEAG